MKKMIAILGPTASGKTALAAAVAARVGGEILSADSRQVYRRMDIGTGKDLADYRVATGGEVKDIPYHLIDICEPGTRYNLFRYLQDFEQAFQSVTEHGALPIVCGGTGLYMEAVLKEYRLSAVPQNAELRKSLQGKSLAELTLMLQELKARHGTSMHNTTDVDSAQRAIRAIEIEMGQDEAPTPSGRTDGTPRGEALIVGVSTSREERRQRITQRLKARLEQGMIDEVRALLAEGISAEDLMYYGLEYKFVTQYVTGLLGYDEMFKRLEIAIHQFAKRQMTWFRGMERRGLTIHWIDAALPLNIKVEQVLRLGKE